MIVKSSEPKILIPETKTEARAMHLIEYAKNKTTGMGNEILITGNEITLLLADDIPDKDPNCRLRGNTNLRVLKKDVMRKASELFPDSIIIKKHNSGNHETYITFKHTPETIWEAEYGLCGIRTRSKRSLKDYEYPSLDDISYLFNTKIQKDINRTTIKSMAFNKEITIRRDLMLRILGMYHNKKFTYEEVKIKLNDRDGDENFTGHWNYLLKYNFIEKTNDRMFMFCDRVRQWKLFYNK